MIEWRDRGTVLAVRAHGETAVILEVLTADHGRHLGLVHGGRSRKRASLMQPGNAVEAVWRARVPDHLGSFAVEPLRTRAGDVLGDPLRLAGLASVCALAAFVLPERAPVPAFQARTDALCDALADGQGWLRDYVAWEMALLAEAGAPLDLSHCAAGGEGALAYVSPRSGRAVSRAGAGDWADRLLELPAVMTGGEATLEGVRAALAVTGHFLERRVAPSLGDRALPAARERLISALQRA
jgi:DNA repair protein RecO (recombination protein O)